MDKKIKSLLISGGKALRKMNDEQLMEYDMWFDEYKKQIEREIGRPLTRKEEERLYKLILGIIQKYGQYDERYHAYLTGNVINER